MRKVFLVRNGKVIIDPSYEKADWAELSVEAIRVRLIEAIKWSSHAVALIVLKSWIISSHAVRGWDRTVRTKLTRFVRRHGQYPKTDSKPSEFIETIRSIKEESS